MSALLYLVVIAGLGLGAFQILRWRTMPRGFGEELYGTEDETSLFLPGDPLVSDLSAKIFDSKDEEFVRTECAAHLRRRFRAERTALALEWARESRKQVDLLIREHLRRARSSAELKPADELKLGFEFLLFRLTNGILRLVIWTFGPPHAAKLVGYPLDFAEKLRKMTDDLLPGGAQVAVELLDVDPKVKNRTATP